MNCEDCKHRMGDGHPYGDITCRVNGKYRYMGRECDTGEYAPIVSDKDLIKQLQAEVDGLKCCGNCRHYLTVINEGRCFEGIKDIYRYDPKAITTDGDCVCKKWQKAGD